MSRREACYLKLPLLSLLTGEKSDSNDQNENSGSTCGESVACHGRKEHSKDSKGRNKDDDPANSSISTAASLRSIWGYIFQSGHGEVNPHTALASSGRPLQQGRVVPHMMSDAGSAVSFRVNAKDLLGYAGAFRDAHVEFEEQWATIHTVDRDGKIWTLDTSDFPSLILPDDSRFSTSMTGEVLTVTVVKRGNLSWPSWRENCIAFTERTPTWNSSTLLHNQDDPPQKTLSWDDFL
eukprot:TRINITY_DN37746_c0_g1_i1.p1 TRINITY_DN37746_c0_g1~~TRINITY_DN37746_c0_g1_i1.p1  ORF type:complete len:236 (-),score=26.69 TRINITY_DN37746_c0_g1_i1:165-872(-)